MGPEWVQFRVNRRDSTTWQVVKFHGMHKSYDGGVTGIKDGPTVAFYLH